MTDLELAKAEVRKRVTPYAWSIERWVETLSGAWEVSISLPAGYMVGMAWPDGNWQVQITRRNGEVLSMIAAGNAVPKREAEESYSASMTDEETKPYNVDRESVGKNIRY